MAWGFISTLDGIIARRPRFCAFSSGVLATLAMAPVFAWPVMFVVFFCLVRLLDGCLEQSGDRRSRLKRALVLGWLFGFGYFVAGLYWISASLFVEPDKFLWLLPFSATLIPAGLGVFHAIAFAAASAAWIPGFARIVSLALALTAAEWLRGHLFTGLPWNVIGYALTAPPFLLQSAAVFGVYALTFPTVLIFGLPAAGWDETCSRRQRLAYVGAPCIALIVLMGFGYQRMHRTQPPTVAGVRLRLVQPNVSQDMKWRFENRADIFRGYLAQSRRNARGEDDGLAGITHVIWPESAIPFLLLGSQEALDAIAGLLPDGVNLITGAIRIDEQAASAGEPARRQVFNSLLSLDDRARLTGSFDKLHLVPFGEYLPFQRLLEAIGLRQLTKLQGGFAVGSNRQRYWQIPGLPPMSPLICYESIFPDEVTTTGPRPAFFLNVTNDGWFGHTTGPHQHLHQARVRSVEQGLPLVRVANTGISAIVDARGQILQSAPLGRAAVIDAALPGALPPTPYGRFGDAFLVLLLVGGLIVVFGCKFRQPSQS